MTNLDIESMHTIDHSAIRQTLFELLAQESKSDVSTIHEDSLLDNLGVDSFSYVEMLMKLEDKFNARINEDIVPGQPIKSVGDMLNSIYNAITIST